MINSQELHKIIDDFDNTPQGCGFSLRLDLSDIIVRKLSGNGVTQQKLAHAAGMKPPQITRLIHASTNCTFDTAGRILHALGIKAKLVEAKEPAIVQTAKAPARSRTNGKKHKRA